MLWVVGNVSGDFKKYCAAHGITYRNFTTVSNSLDPTAIYIDVSSKQTILDSVKAAGALDVTALIVTGYEHFVLPAAWLGEYFGVPSCSELAARQATDKLLMRTAFMAADPSITPEFSIAESWDDIVTFMETHHFPVMLKPANLMKSLFITKNDNLDELKANFELLQEYLPEIYDQRHLGSPRVIVEEFLAGSMHTVAGFVDEQGTPHLLPQIVDCRTARDAGVPDSYLFSRQLPSSLSLPDQAIVLNVTDKAVRALGLQSTPIHAELMYTADGPKVIEIGARLGGYRPRMYDIGYGIDLYRAALDTAQGQSVNVAVQLEKAVSFVELFPNHDGIFIGKDVSGQIEKLASFRHVSWKYKAGERVGTAGHGYRAVAILTLAHDDLQQIERDQQWLIDTYILPVE